MGEGEGRGVGAVNVAHSHIQKQIQIAEELVLKKRWMGRQWDILPPRLSRAKQIGDLEAHWGVYKALFC